MPRAMWKGAISFGLVTIPVSVYPATEEKTLRFNQLHDEDGGRIRMKRTCSVDGEEVGYEHIVKGYEYEKDRYVILTDDDFEAVPVESSRAIDIQQFVDLEEIDPMMYKKSYYLVPEETGAKAYALLREALNRSGKVGVAKVSFRDKEHLAALRFRDEAFVLETMYWPDEIREADFGGVDVSAKVRPNELEMAQTLIDNLTADWDPAEFKDEYREAMLRIVEAKINGEEIEVVEAEPTAKVVDLMEALKASVAAAKKEAKAAARRQEEGAGPEEDRGQEAGGEEAGREEAGGSQEGRRGVISPPAGFTARPATRDDIDGMARLVAGGRSHDEGIVEPVRGHIEDEWANPLFHAEDDTMLAIAADGTLAAFATCWGIEPASSVEAWINVHPVHRGVGLGHLVDAMGGAPRAPLPHAAWDVDTAPARASPSDAGRAFLGRLGYRHVRTFWHMSRRLDGSERPGSPPDGVTIRPYRDGDGRRSTTSSRPRSRVTSGGSRWPTTHGRRRRSGRLRRTSHSSSSPSGTGSWSGRSRRRSTRRSRGWPRWACSKPIAGPGSAGRSCGGRSPSWPPGAGRSSSSTWTARTVPGPSGCTSGEGMTPGRSWDFYEKRIDAD